jgi:two-component system, sensor histidine kinase PdtaS
MATMAELARDFTELDSATLTHLQRLVGSWGMLADLCFADLLLFVPVDRAAERFIVVGQMRPTTSQTLHRDDLVGHIIDQTERPLVQRCWQLETIVEGEVGIPSRNERGRLVCIPVRKDGHVVAVLTRESALSVGRRPGELERVYVEVFDRFAGMISDGEFPFPVDDVVTSEAPRVGDGVLVLDSWGRVEYASPNAINALHRMGLYSNVEGTRLDEAGAEETATTRAFATRLPVTEEVEQGPDVAVLTRCIPLLEGGSVSGALVLMRDVSDLRRRDRLLLSKDAAIREVHHRVKNNLQTISSLLRLQARRLDAGEGKSALEEAERRIRSIALVHEILSRDATDQVDFNDILPSLVRMAEDLLPHDQPVRIGVHGEAGELSADVATPLAVILTELLQNAAEHAFPEDSSYRPSEPLRIHVGLSRRVGKLLVEVRDNGAGLPAGFSVDKTTSLGLSIVRDLVRTQLGGTISMHTDHGTTVELTIPVHARPVDRDGAGAGLP